MQPNLLLISIDTLRADVCYSGRFPNLERFKKESTWFQQVVSSTPLTPASHATIFTGLQPGSHGIHHLFVEQMCKDAKTLASILRDEGYSTAAVTSCPGMNSWYGLDQGFLHYDDEVEKLSDGRNALEIVDVRLRGTATKRAPIVVERAVRWLENQPREPWFLFTHFFDCHWPYKAPDTYSIPIENDYEGEVAYVDHHLGRLLKEIERLDYDLNELLIVCLSDHGEDLAGWYTNDHAGSKGYPEEEGHGCLLFDATQMVPLMFRWPKQFKAGQEISSQVRLVDVCPTILDLLDVPIPEMDGVSLLPLLDLGEDNHRLAYCETFYRQELASHNQEFKHLQPLQGVRIDNRWKIVWELGSFVVEVYDLLVDPEEKDPLSFFTPSPIGYF